MALEKKRVHWHEVNSDTGEVIADKDVDIYTSADAVTCEDGETVQEKLNNSIAKKSDIGLLNGLKTTDKTSIVSAINEVKEELGNNSSDREISFDEYENLTEEEKMNGTTYYVPDVIIVGKDAIEIDVIDGILCITYDDGIEEGSEE